MTDTDASTDPSREKVRELDRRAVLRSAEIVALARDDQWDAPTPCGGWSLRRLLAHMAAQHLGFAAAAGGGPVDEAVWQETPLDDPRRAYADSVDRVLDAFAADGVLDRTVVLPWIHPTMTFAAPRAIGFHLVDYVVHGWDVAASLGIPAAYDEDLVLAAAEVARKEVPSGPSRERPGASFRPAVELAGPASAEDRLLASLGRDPWWPPK
ncbi:TIGR03086 family metal-binding protein [Streptomyces sp. NBC_00378]|uniref:TIGR03086 family metal-binding protein n=1 Tax=unclassified Streptomyces TaxID=2593676 RepID=UPI0022576C05|nr:MULTISPECIES: TIGR03086 family metal-binding protein [unclassified Streptomyces]MCX5108779.1 TIGR03086 family metal-binding protein [Streptomyces sp. NBC_00378]